MNAFRFCSFMILCSIAAFAAEPENKLIGTWEGTSKKRAIVVQFGVDGHVSITVDGAPARADMTFVYAKQAMENGVGSQMPWIKGSYLDGRKGGLSTGIIEKGDDTFQIGLPEDFNALIPHMDQVELKRKK